MMGIDDELLMAFADGELDEVTRARVERAIAEDPALAARLEVQRRLKARLAAHYAPAADEDVPERLRSLLESNVVPLAPRRARPLWQSLSALAATLVVGLLVGRSLAAPDLIGVEDGALVAEGALADALETQLASTQADGAATAIGVTFARADGQVCRTFLRRDLSGLACREAEGWRLVVATEGLSPPAGGAFRQAASGNGPALEAAQALMAGEPFDARAERQARDSGWRGGAGSR